MSRQEPSTWKRKNGIIAPPQRDPLQAGGRRGIGGQRGGSFTQRHCLQFAGRQKEETLAKGSAAQPLQPVRPQDRRWRVCPYRHSICSPSMTFRISLAGCSGFRGFPGSFMCSRSTKEVMPVSRFQGRPRRPKRGIIAPSVGGGRSAIGAAEGAARATGAIGMQQQTRADTVLSAANVTRCVIRQPNQRLETIGLQLAERGSRLDTYRAFMPFRHAQLTPPAAKSCPRRHRRVRKRPARNDRGHGQHDIARLGIEIGDAQRGARRAVTLPKNPADAKPCGRRVARPQDTCPHPLETDPEGFGRRNDRSNAFG